MARYWNSRFEIKPDAKRMKRGGKLRTTKPMNKVGRRGKRESPRLIRWRREVRERDNFTCQYPGCGYRSKHIDAHHIAKRTARPDLKFTTSNGICLCRQHHNWTDTNLQEAIVIGLRNTESYELAKKREAA